MSSEARCRVCGASPAGADGSRDLEREWEEYEAQFFEELRIAEEGFEQAMIEMEANRCWLDRLFDRIGFGVVWPGIAELDRPFSLWK